MLFLSPGRHAGPSGDIARICAAAQQRHPELRIVMTDLVGRHAGLIPILADRVRTGLASPPR
jgi:sirohydrochlorin ferrochelatase